MAMFVEHFLACSNASEAVRLAGYVTNNEHKLGSELRRHPLVSKAIDEGHEKRKERMEITADYLLAKLVDVIDNDTDRTSDKLRAIELAGKAIALWKERQEISGPDGGAIAMEQKRINDDVSDFTSRIARLAKRNGTDGVSEFPKPGADG